MPARTNGDGSFAVTPWTAGDITAMGIRTFDVRTGNHPTETRRADESTMTRTFFVNWTSRYDFVQFVLGDSVLYSTGGGSPVTKISRLLPADKYGRHPVKAQIMATRVEYIKGHGVGRDDSNQFPDYGSGTGCAEIQVFYEHAPFAASSDAGTASERARFTSRAPVSHTDAEAFTLPGATLKYVTVAGGAPHGVPVPFNVSFVRPVQRFTMVWHMLPNALYASGGALFERLFNGVSGDGIAWVGTVNKEDLVLPGLGTYKAGSLLLEGIEDRRLTSPLADDGLSGLRWDISFKFAFTPRLWTDLWYYDPGTPANSGYYRVTNNGTYYAVSAIPDKVGLYNLRDFTSLWDANL